MASLRAGIRSDKSQMVTRLGHGNIHIWANTWGGRIGVSLLRDGSYSVVITDFGGGVVHQTISGSIPAPIRKRDGTLRPRVAPKPTRTPKPKKVIKAAPFVGGPVTSLLTDLASAITERLPESGNGKADPDNDTLPLSDEDRALMEAI